MPEESMMLRACFTPIGVVEEGLPKPWERGPRGPFSRFEVVSRIRIFDDYVEGLRGLEEFSHVIVVYWMHEEHKLKLIGYPWGDERWGLVGILATRFPPRPNPIGVTVVELVDVRPPYLLVRGLDAWTGTPVLDIKPYDYFDIVKKPRVPQWFVERWEQWKRRGRRDLAPWLGPCEDS
jgi:tRNA-Thr(GGU) m(6)t(6)A37 methyltransferase TsaA